MRLLPASAMRAKVPSDEIVNDSGLLNVATVPIPSALPVDPEPATVVNTDVDKTSFLMI
jgi:hypothetical protein